MRTAELEYELPPELIASEPPPERHGARLLVMDRASGALSHQRVLDLPSLLPSNALLVVNDTRVIPARLFGTKPTGGRAEIFLLRASDPSWRTWTAFGRASKPLRAGQTITVAEGFAVEINEKRDDGTLAVTLITDDPARALETHGQVPLPPYVSREVRPEDRERYQTVFARAPGAVAAPTAGLHLSTELLESLAAKGIERATVTLHVGAGTFAPVTADDLDAHNMHTEYFEVPEETARAVLSAKREGRPVIAVGTTVVRALESWRGVPGAPRAGDTKLLIQPGYSFALVDGLLTNFHLPRSTLLALVMAFAGIEPVREAYRVAIAERYRFYSYGDAMLIS